MHCPYHSRMGVGNALATIILLVKLFLFTSYERKESLLFLFFFFSSSLVFWYLTSNQVSCTMLGGRKSVYNPLDRSQIAFIPTDLESIYESIVDSQVIHESPFEGEMFEHEILKDSDDLLMQHITASHSVFSTNYARSIDTSVVDSERLSQISSRKSLSSDVVDGMRYKIVLRLTAREIQLIRDSWSMMLNDDVPTNKLSAFFRKLVGTANSLTPISSNNVNAQNRRNSVSSLQSGQAASIGGGSIGGASASSSNVQASQQLSTNTVASSLFCSQFYANLLSMDPNLEKMFPSIKHQAISFAGVLTTAINNLENLSALDSYLNNLGKRHARILGIQTPHFELMGVAFLKTIQDRFGVHCTLELEETWSRLYSYLANSILQFGIDPVLKIDISQDMLIFPVPNLVNGTSSTTSSLLGVPRHDAPDVDSQDTISTSSSGSVTPSDPSRNTALKPKQDPESSVIISSAKAKPRVPTKDSVSQTSPLPTSSASQVPKAKSKLAKRAERLRNGGQGKDCVIM